jgi:hypothetical protein
MTDTRQRAFFVSTRLPAELTGDPASMGSFPQCVNNPQGIFRHCRLFAARNRLFAMSLGERIREQIKSRGLSMRKIHLETGLDRSTIRRFITTGSGNIQTLDAIAEFLGATVSFPPPPKEPAAKKAKPGK